MVLFFFHLHQNLKKQDQLVDDQADRVHKERKEMEVELQPKEPTPQAHPPPQSSGTSQQYDQYQQPPPQQQQQQQVITKK